MLLLSLRTRFPVSKSRATGSCTVPDTLDDQITLFVWLKRTRFPVSLKVKTPFRSAMGLFLFATQTTAPGLFLYHIPKYLFLDFPGEKKPSSKVSNDEISVSPSLIDPSTPKTSASSDNSKCEKTSTTRQIKVNTGAVSMLKLHCSPKQVLSTCLHILQLIGV
ncbi:hypothetical protein Gohar_014085 [Gossypium harknessii]|uniref:Uncharacterized protein n=1 Tax=Gossypium harknessii TaxID=34285 RepID=A0A7J9H4P6_9ROSI|nr:hypothetical protein [Gossypium harknessii]